MINKFYTIFIINVYFLFYNNSLYCYNFLELLSNIKNTIFNISTIFVFKDLSDYHSIGWDDLLGFSNEKKELQKMVEIILNKNIKHRISFIVGPEGMRKNDFVFVFAKHVKIPIIHISLNINNIKNFISDLDKIEELNKNSQCILYIDNIDILSLEYMVRSEVGLLTYYLNNKKYSNIIFIFGIRDISTINYLYRNDLLFDNRDPKIYSFDMIDKNDLIFIINHFLYKNKLELESNDVINKFLLLFNQMSIDDIESYILELKYDLALEGRTLITFDDCNIFLKKIQKKKLLIQNDISKKEYSCAYIKDKTLDDIWGYKDIKEKLYNIIPQIVDKDKKQRGILLYGPPGVGKTQIVKALAGSAEVRLIVIEPAKILSGNIAENINDVFLKSKNSVPVILFFDEIDFLVNNEVALSSLLIELDGINKLLGVTVIGATNYPDEINQRLKRSGRLSVQIGIDYPNKIDRQEIIFNYLKQEGIKFFNNSIIENMVERTNGFSGADIKEYVYMIKLYLEENKIECLTFEGVFDVFLDMVLGSKKDLLMTQKELMEVAFHEVCHGFLQYILYKNNKSINDFSFITIEPRENILGVSFSIGDDYYKSYKKEYLESDLKIALAGKCGQDIFLQSVDAGAVSDLEYATKIAYLYVDKFGMGSRLAVKNKIFRYEFEQSDDIIKEVNLLLNKQYNKVKKILLENKILILNLVDEVLKKKILHKSDFDLIIKKTCK